MSQPAVQSYADPENEIFTWPSLIGCLPVILPNGVLATTTCIEISEESFKDANGVSFFVDRRLFGFISFW